MKLEIEEKYSRRVLLKVNHRTMILFQDTDSVLLNIIHIKVIIINKDLTLRQKDNRLLRKPTRGLYSRHAMRPICIEKERQTGDYPGKQALDAVHLGY
jgi:hypothetical protein